MKRTETRETEMLRSARKKSGLSQLQLAAELNVQLRQYQRLEYGERSFSSVNIKLGLNICRILHIDPYDLVFGESLSINSYMQTQNKPPGTIRRTYNSSLGQGAYHDPTADKALYNVTLEWHRMRRLAIRLRLNGEEPDPMLFTGIFRRLLSDPLEELMVNK